MNPITFTLPANRLCALREFAGRDDTRPYLNGICFTNRRMVATDGAILGCFRIDTGVAEPFEFIAPVELFDGLAAEGSLVSISLTLGMVTVTQDGGVKSIPAIEGKFPDWKRVVPQEVSNDPGQFDPNLVSRISEAYDELRGGDSGFPGIAHNGPMSAALIDFYDEDFVGVIMPIRAEPPALVAPEWVFRDA